jgi:predicted HTH domain antitoxin
LKTAENNIKNEGDTMRGSLIQTEARAILNRGISQGISECKKEIALRMLKMGKLTVEEIAEYSALSVAEVEQLANPQTI